MGLRSMLTFLSGTPMQQHLPLFHVDGQEDMVYSVANLKSL